MSNTPKTHADAGPGSSEGLGLVERLREMSSRGYWPLLGHEAAEEIERLREALQAMVDCSHTMDVHCCARAKPRLRRLCTRRSARSAAGGARPATKTN